VSRHEIADVLARVDLRDVMAQAGVELNARGWACCPFHQEATPSFHVREKDGGQHYKCFGCGEGGDALSALQLLEGITFPEALARLGGSPSRCAPAPRPLAAPRPKPKPLRPRLEEVRRLLGACVLVEDDAEVARFVEGRGVDPSLVSSSIALALPRAAEVPLWAQAWRWRHRLVIPAYDPAGEVVSFKARDVTEEAGAKELSPSGFGIHGLVYASASGALLLRRPEVFIVERTELLIVEGGMDFVAACVASPQRPAWALPGAGHWSPELAERVPSGVRVLVAVDEGEAGERFSRAIEKAFGARCPLVRVCAGAAI
jgi:hypothetical protein